MLEKGTEMTYMVVDRPHSVLDVYFHYNKGYYCKKIHHYIAKKMKNRTERDLNQRLAIFDLTPRICL